jgi:hypothetical protein
MKASCKIPMVVFALAISAMLSVARAADSIVGTWRLVSWTEEETQSKAVHKNFVDRPDGLSTFTSDGRMMIMFTDPTRKPPATPKATDAEAAQLYRTMVAFAGKYRTEGNKAEPRGLVEPGMERDGADALFRDPRRSTPVEDDAVRKPVPW